MRKESHFTDPNKVTLRSNHAAVINGLISDENALLRLFLDPTSSDLPDAYRFENFDPKVDRIRALTKELFLSGGESL